MGSNPTLLDATAERTLPRVAQGSLLTLLLLSLGHCFVDIYSSALGALQPLLVDHFRLSYTQAGILGGVLVFSSSVMQPVYGFFSDRWRTRMFAALGPLVAGLFISALGLAPGYGWLVAMVWLGGIGIAMFHPQASARATFGLESGRGRAMAIFVSAGTVGFSLGPTYFSAIAGRWGLSGTWLAAMPGVFVSVLLLALLPHAEPFGSREPKRLDWRPLQAAWKPLTILYLLVFLRSVVQITFAQFLPLYLHVERGFAFSTANHTLSLYLFGGALGGFLGGHLADRFGGRTVIQLSMIGSVPFLVLFFLAPGAFSLLGLFLGGLMLLFTIPVNVVMAQELAPGQSGTVSALMMGFGWGMAGLIFIPITGWAFDHFPMRHVLLSLAAAPALGFLLALKLPRSVSP